MYTFKHRQAHSFMHINTVYECMCYTYTLYMRMFVHSDISCRIPVNYAKFSLKCKLNVANAVPINCHCQLSIIWYTHIHACMYVRTNERIYVWKSGNTFSRFFICDSGGGNGGSFHLSVNNTSPHRIKYGTFWKFLFSFLFFGFSFFFLRGLFIFCWFSSLS